MPKVCLAISHTRNYLSWIMRHAALGGTCWLDSIWFISTLLTLSSYCLLAPLLPEHLKLNASSEFFPSYHRIRTSSQTNLSSKILSNSCACFCKLPVSFIISRHRKLEEWAWRFNPFNNQCIFWTLFSTTLDYLQSTNKQRILAFQRRIWRTNAYNSRPRQLNVIGNKF